MRSFALLFHNRNFGRIWLGGLISLTGDWMLFVALPVYAYQLTGSAAATGAMLAARIVPRILLGTVAGVFVDRWDRRQTLIVANLVLAAGLLPLLLAVTASQLWIVYGVAFLQACVAQFVLPAEDALLPRLVGPDDLIAANSLNTLNNNLARLIGPPIGGLVIASTSLAGVALIDATSFVFAALLIWLTRVDARPQTDRSAQRAATVWVSLWVQWRDGLAHIRQSRVLTVILLFAAITMMGEGVMGTLIIPFVINVLESDELGVGWLLSAQAIGGIAGSLALSWRPPRWSPARMVGVGALGLGIFDLMIFNYHVLVPGLWPALVLIGIAGVPVAAMLVGYSTLKQLAAPDAFRGRAIGAISTTGALASLSGTALGGALGDSVGIVLVLNLQCVAYLIAGTLFLVLLRHERTEQLVDREAEAMRGASSARESRAAP